MMAMLSLALELSTKDPRCPRGLKYRADRGRKGSGRSYYGALVE